MKDQKGRSHIVCYDGKCYENGCEISIDELSRRFRQSPTPELLSLFLGPPGPGPDPELIDDCPSSYHNDDPNKCYWGTIHRRYGYNV